MTLEIDPGSSILCQYNQQCSAASPRATCSNDSKCIAGATSDIKCGFNASPAKRIDGSVYACRCGGDCPSGYDCTTDAICCKPPLGTCKYCEDLLNQLYNIDGMSVELYQ